MMKITSIPASIPGRTRELDMPTPNISDFDNPRSVKKGVKKSEKISESDILRAQSMPTQDFLNVLNI